MVTAAPEDVRRGLVTISALGFRELGAVMRRSPRAARTILLDLGPAAMANYTLGSSALAADWYEELREASGARAAFRAESYLWRREEKFSRALVWATEPLQFDDADLVEALSRLGSAVDYEVFNGFTEAVDGNVRTDREALGYSRNANYGTACKFCLMLAERGALYRKEKSARFAAHTNCQCAYVPVFEGGERGPEASVIQYQASQRYRTKAQRDANNARVRAYLNEHYPDAPG